MQKAWRRQSDFSYNRNVLDFFVIKEKSAGKLENTTLIQSRWRVIVFILLLYFLCAWRHFQNRIFLRNKTQINEEEEGEWKNKPERTFTIVAEESPSQSKWEEARERGGCQVQVTFPLLQPSTCTDVPSLTLGLPIFEWIVVGAGYPTRSFPFPALLCSSSFKFSDGHALDIKVAFY